MSQRHWSCPVSQGQPSTSWPTRRWDRLFRGSLAGGATRRVRSTAGPARPETAETRPAVGPAGGRCRGRPVGQEGAAGAPGCRSPHFANTGFLGALEAIGRVLEQETRQNATGSPSRTQIRHLGRPARPAKALYAPADRAGRKTAATKVQHGPDERPATLLTGPRSRPDGQTGGRPADQPPARRLSRPLAARQQGGPPQTSLPHLPREPSSATTVPMMGRLSSTTGV